MGGLPQTLKKKKNSSPKNDDIDDGDEKVHHANRRAPFRGQQIE